jgi:hypothetical protein
MAASGTQMRPQLAPARARATVAAGTDVDAVRFGTRSHRLHALLDELVDGDWLERPGDFSGLEPGQLEQVGDEEAQ